MFSSDFFKDNLDSETLKKIASTAFIRRRKVELVAFTRELFSTTEITDENLRLVLTTDRERFNDFITVAKHEAQKM